MRSIKHQAFTLIEVLIGIVIMGVTMLAVAMVMRTSVRSWQVGHAMTESTQTTRITQDVMLRDLSNIFYMSESDYNRSFRSSIEEFGTMLDVGEVIDPGRTMDDYRRRKRDRDRASRRSEERAEAQAEEKIQEAIDSRRIDDITPPINLSFDGSDGGKLDTISFTRRHDPRWVEEPATWGLRRVTYSVRDGILYRREDDPFGLSPNMGKSYAWSPAMQQLLRFYERPKEGSSLGGLGVSMLPEQITLEEPMCEGVEVFDVTYGYFRSEKWREVTNWQSSASQYRGLPDLDSPEFEALTSGMRLSELNAVRPMLSALTGGPNRTYDELPAYVAIQLGVRLEGQGKKGQEKKGRIFSYTFYHSFPQSQETDQPILMPDGRDLRSMSARDERSRRRRDGRRE